MNNKFCTKPTKNHSNPHPKHHRQRQRANRRGDRWKRKRSESGLNGHGATGGEEGEDTRSLSFMLSLAILFLPFLVLLFRIHLGEKLCGIGMGNGSELLAFSCFCSVSTILDFFIILAKRTMPRNISRETVTEKTAYVCVLCVCVHYFSINWRSFFSLSSFPSSRLHFNLIPSSAPSRTCLVPPMGSLKSEDLSFLPTLCQVVR